MNAPTVADWRTLGAFRGCDAHERQHGISYQAVMESTGPNAAIAALGAAEKAGMRCKYDEWDDHPDAHRDCYAVLDICDQDGDIVADRCIPTREVFDWWIKTVELRVNSTECPAREDER